jgi:uncharacterized membrane protein (UPF0127 family)
MKWIISAIILSIIAICGLLYWRNLQVHTLYAGYDIMSYQIENKKYKLLVANSPQKWEKGLMDYRKLEGVNGMIFLFPEKNYQNFWNKNTLMDLDLYWMTDNKVVGKSFLPSIEKSGNLVTVSSPDKVDVVVEIPHH